MNDITPAVPADPRPAPAPPQTLQRAPIRLVTTVLHLVALGMFVAPLVAGVFIFGFTGALATLPLLGVGVVVLVSLIYPFWALAWFEHERVAALYGLDIPPLAFPKSADTGFAGWVKTLGNILGSGRVWAAFASLLVSVSLGVTLVIGTAASAIRTARAVLAASVPGTLTPDLIVGEIGYDFPGILILEACVLAAITVATPLLLAVVHRVISVAIIGYTSRETALTERAQRSDAQRRGAVRAATLDRTRIERDLHDGVQPRLVSIGMTLGLARQQFDDNPEQARLLIDEAHASTQAAITELRQLARGIHTSVLDDRGLEAALSALVTRLQIPVKLDVQIDHRATNNAEAAMYFTIAESLTNVAKHSRASECRVVVRSRPDTQSLWARIEDDGVGGGRILQGGGIDGLQQRIDSLGGTYRIDSPVGGPTTVEVSIPCES